MKKLSLILILITIVSFMSCKNESKKENPLLVQSTTPFQVPPFDKIDTTDYLPAFREAVKQHLTEIDAIVNNGKPADFDNTILAFDKSGYLLMKIYLLFENLNQANTNPRMQAIARELEPLYTKHEDDIYLNEKLFQRIKTVYDNRQAMKPDSQQLRVVVKYYKDFVKRGANLPKEKQEQLRKINTELSTLTLTFGENLLAENKAFKLVIDNKEDLDGLPRGLIDGAAESAKSAGMDGKWVFTMAKPSWIPFLQYSTKRDLREKIYRGWFMRGDNGNKNDNNELVVKIVKLRAEKASLLGFKSYAAYVIDENMAKTPEKVDDFLMKLWKAALPVAKNEVVEMQKIVDKDGGKFKLEPWDWWYYAEKVRKEKYDLDENELKPYFSLNNVRDGMFMVANKLYGITFTKRTDLPVYEKNDVEVFEAKEADGRHLGILYLDYYPRDGKNGGAWCTAFLPAGWRDGKRVDPVVSLVCNATRPTKDLPSLMGWEETTTLFHEFGHALHALFVEGKYDRTAGNVPQDYVEMPSQFMENWAGNAEVLKMYAKHYKTGEPIPQKLIDKITKSSKFNQGFETVEYLAASLLDMDYHNLVSPKNIKVKDFEKQALDSIGLIKEILPRYRSTYFAHIFNGEYAAGYYVYIWAAVLDADAFNAFKSSGELFNKELAGKFRKYCLAESGNDEGMVQYKKFRGQEPSIEPLLERRGLK